PFGAPPQMGSPQMGGAAGGPTRGGAAGPTVSDPGAKTVIAGQAPPNLQDLIRKQAPADAKTIIAGVNSPAIPGRGAMANPNPQINPPGHGGPPGMGRGQPPGAPNADDEGPPKTMILADSEGVVSFARGHTGESQPLGQQLGLQPTSSGIPQPDEGGGASTVFWIASLVTGLAIGVLAYLVVLAVS
ncbi:MAG: hypothetical protein AAGC55_15315, partial [Myxococcota bacterium]